MLSGNTFTKGLIVLQFMLAIFLVVGTIAINSQMNFLLKKDLGYESKNLVAMYLPWSSSSDKLPALFKKRTSWSTRYIDWSLRAIWAGILAARKPMGKISRLN
jgi:hypothetical protein